MFRKKTKTTKTDVSPEAKSAPKQAEEHPTFQEFLTNTYHALKGKDFWSVTESYLDPETHQKEHNTYYRSDRLKRFTFYRSWNIQHDPEPGPSMVEFDLILELYVPNITILQYNSIYREVVEQGEDTYTDWYDTHTTYEAYRGFNVEKLFLALRARKLI